MTMSRCSFVGHPPVPFLPFCLDLNKLTPEGAKEVEDAARTSEPVPVNPTSEAGPVSSSSRSSRPSFSARQYLIATPASVRALSAPATVTRAPLLSFTNFLRAQMPTSTPVRASEAAADAPAQVESAPPKRRGRQRTRVYKPLKLDPVSRPEALGSEDTVGSSVLYSSKSATSYLQKKGSRINEDTESSDSPLPSPPNEAAQEVPEDMLIGTPPETPAIEVPVDLSLAVDPELAELQEFEERLASTGLYPGAASEEIVEQYGGQSVIPEAPVAVGEDVGVVHMVNLARAVGVEVAQANHVLVKELLDRQGKLIYPNIHFYCSPRASLFTFPTPCKHRVSLSSIHVCLFSLHQSFVLAEMIHELSTSMAAMRQQMRQVSVSPVRPSLKRPLEVTSSSSRAVPEATSAPSPSSPNSSSDESPHERLSPSKRKDSKLERVNPAWTWTPEMQAKVPWMSKFISGPRDPESNPTFCVLSRLQYFNFHQRQGASRYRSSLAT